MRILIDINHPAHAHYFRNFIKIMEREGHEFFILNRDSKMINQLLDFYGIKHIIRNKRPDKKGSFASLMNLLKMIIWCTKESISFKPDMYIGFGSSACAVTSRIFRKPCILMDDTEHNNMNHKIYYPCCSTVLTPFYFNKNLGKGKNSKQIKFDAFVEQLYLHSKYYNKRTSVLEELDILPQEYALVRFIAYDAHHDIGAKPLSLEAKKRIVEKISQKTKVLVSLEKSIDDPYLNQFVLKISPEKMHDLEANAKFMITEGATMASESYVLGVPYIYLNPLRCGNIDYQCEENPNRAFQTTDLNEVMAKIDDFLKADIDTEKEKAEIEKRTTNPTDLLIWLVKNYPKSCEIMKNNPRCQDMFK